MQVHVAVIQDAKNYVISPASPSSSADKVVMNNVDDPNWLHNVPLRGDYQSAWSSPLNIFFLNVPSPGYYQSAGGPPHRMGRCRFSRSLQKSRLESVVLLYARIGRMWKSSVGAGICQPISTYFLTVLCVKVVCESCVASY